MATREREHEREEVRGLHAEAVKQHARGADPDVEIVKTVVVAYAEEGHRSWWALETRCITVAAEPGPPLLLTMVGELSAHT